MGAHAIVARDHCPHCGQSMHVVRFGVPLTPLKARIFDLIEQRPGITWDEIARTAFDRWTSRDTVKAHIWQINDAFTATDIEVRGAFGPHGGYRVRRGRAA